MTAANVTGRTLLGIVADDRGDPSAGDYRVLHTIDEGRLVVLVFDAGYRSEIYGR